MACVRANTLFNPFFYTFFFQELFTCWASLLLEPWACGFGMRRKPKLHRPAVPSHICKNYDKVISACTIPHRHVIPLSWRDLVTCYQICLESNFMTRLQRAICSPFSVHQRSAAAIYNIDLPEDREEAALERNHQLPISRDLKERQIL